MADLAALEALAAKAIPTQELQRQGFLSVGKYGDLHKHGYTIVRWYLVAAARSVYEYREYMTGNKLSGLPRITVDTYRDQCLLHKALGLNLVGPAETWRDFGGSGLFDDHYEQEADHAARLPRGVPGKEGV